jgi:hypothetical protein
MVKFVVPTQTGLADENPIELTVREGNTLTAMFLNAEFPQVPSARTQ